MAGDGKEVKKEEGAVEEFDEAEIQAALNAIDDAALLAEDGDGAEEADAGGDDPDAQLEAQAREQGWRPKEEYKGDPDKWIDAKEFVDRKPFYDTISKQSRSIKKLEKTIDALVKHNKKVSEKEFERAKAYLMEQRKLAAEDNDAAGMLEIQEKLDNLEEPDVPEMDVSEEDVWEDFRSRNSWYDNDPVVRYAVDGYMNEFVKGKNLSPEQMAEEAERFAQDSFADRLNPKPRTSRVASASRRQSPASNKKKPSMAEEIRRLSPEAKLAYRELVQNSKELTHDQYMAQYKD